VTESRTAPKRSMLLQQRSRDTRRSIISAALALWSERGYDTGIEETKAEEIASRAGVSKATFYLHFARKEDILFEAGWLTSEVLYDDALAALRSTASADVVMSGLMEKLCRRVERVPRPALQRMLELLKSRAGDDSRYGDVDHFGFQRVFSLVFVQAQPSGDIPATVPAGELAAILESLLVSAIGEWANDESVDLRSLVRRRTAIVLAGARSVTPQAVAAVR
jgi:AcrR family transcriptional regulator